MTKEIIRFYNEERRRSGTVCIFYWVFELYIL